MTEKTELTVPEEFHLERIDRVLTIALELDLSRSYIQKLIKDENILVNDLPVKANYKAKTDDHIVITIPEPEVLDLVAQDIPLNIIYQDNDVAVINKQPGLVVHPGPGNHDSTLVNALLYHLTDLSTIGGTIGPGIVHRLDKDTTGLMVIAKNDNAHRHLVEEFSNRRVKKQYQAIVVGKPKKDHNRIEAPLARHRKYRHKMTIDENGKEAITDYRIKEILRGRQGLFSHLYVNIHTGRTHQIRVHLSSMGNPIAGDPIYSKKWEKHKVPFLLLAATNLSFVHPSTGEEMNFEIDIPQHMVDFIEKNRET